MWFCKHLEKDKVLGTKRDTRCLKVLLNLSMYSISQGG